MTKAHEPTGAKAVEQHTNERPVFIALTTVIGWSKNVSPTCSACGSAILDVTYLEVKGRWWPRSAIEARAFHSECAMVALRSDYEGVD